MSAWRRFDAKVDRSGECHLWCGGVTGSGYGGFKVEGRMVSAHIFAYEHAYGPLSSGQVVRHTCDVKLCVRPEHLLSGTHADNERDAAERNRKAHDEDLPQTKLSVVQVVEIKRRLAAGEKQISLAQEFGVVKGAISHIATGRNRRRVEI